MRTRTKKALWMVVVGLAGLVSYFAQEQGYGRYIRYNWWALPTITLLLVVVFLVLLFETRTAKACVTWVRDKLGARHPRMADSILILLFALVGGSFGFGYLRSLDKSKAHLQLLRQESERAPAPARADSPPAATPDNTSPIVTEPPLVTDATEPPAHKTQREKLAEPTADAAPTPGPVRQPVSIVQEGDANIAQVGENLQATIVHRKRLVLTPEDAGAITDALRSHAGRKIKILLFNATTETAQFGAGLAAAFKNAGIEVVEVGYMMGIGPMPEGICLYLSKANPDMEFVEALAQILAARKLAQAPIPAEMTNSDVLIVYVTPYS